MARSGKLKSILVIIPTYNEADNIGPILASLADVQKTDRRRSYHVLVVDDTSPDGTAELVRTFQKSNPNVELLIGKKQGLGQAYLRAFNHALSGPKFEAIIMMDADLSHDPAEIPLLIDKLNDGYDYVIGSRYMKTSVISQDWPKSRVVISKIANAVANALVDNKGEISDLTGGFKAIRRSALAGIDLEAIHAHGFILQVSLLHAFRDQGLKIAEVPIHFKNRHFGSSKFKLNDVVEFIYRAYKLNPAAPIQRFARFAIVGACGTVVNLGMLSLLVEVFSMSAQTAILIAIEVSILFNFVLNHLYTFGGYGAYRLQKKRETLRALAKKLLIYNLGALGGAAISFATFSLFYSVVQLHYLLADLIAILAAMSWNYWISTHFVWQRIDPQKRK